MTTPTPAYSFIQISDIHYDPHYVSQGNEYCHSENESNELGLSSEKAREAKDRYGRPGSECDSPLVLIEKTIVELHRLDPDLIFWTGDSSRHDRDYNVPRHPLDIIQGIKRVAGLINSAFRVGSVFPTVGNWDTLVQNAPSLEDYQFLFQIWSILWNERQKLDIQVTFLEGGFYSVQYSKDLVLVSLNTIEFYIDNVGGDCRKHNEQLEWLESTLEEVRHLNQSVIIIGHVPPLSYLGTPLYHPRCFSTFTNLIGRYSREIISQYYGHVNRDVAYLTIRQTDNSTQMIPLTQTTLSNMKFEDYEVIGQFFTGSSVVPNFYPSFRWGQIASTGPYNPLFIMEHVQYYAPIDTFTRNEPSIFYRESCRTSELSMNHVTPIDWKELSARIQHEIVVSGSSSLAQYYWECSTVHWISDTMQQNLKASPFHSKEAKLDHNQQKQQLQLQNERAYNQALDFYYFHFIIFVIMLLVSFFVAKKVRLTKCKAVNIIP